MVSELERDEATARGEEMLRTLPGATAVHFDRQSRQITVDLNRGFSISFRPERVQDLETASDDDVTEVEITSAGLGIYFPRVDADLWVPSLVAGRFGNDRWEAAWAAAHRQDQAA